MSGVSRPWTEIDWDAERPSPADVQGSRRRISFEPVVVDRPATSRLVDVFRSSRTNGGALVATFAVREVDATAHWLLSRNRFEELGFLELLLTSDALAAALPELGGVDEEPAAGFEESHPLLWDGQLAGALTWRGSHGRFPGSAADAKRLGREVSDEVIGGRYEEFRLDLSHEYWAEWFGAVAWDETWVLTDARQQQVTLLCVTDTD